MKRQAPGPRIMVIPDTQVKPGVPIDHLEWAGRYAADKRPDVIVHMGDHYDFPSLSSYDKGKLSGEGRRYKDDIKAGDDGLLAFEKGLRQGAPRSYDPRKVVTLGNHENRLLRAVEEDPRLAGKLTLDDLLFESAGWEVHPFLKPTLIHEITFSHYFPLNASGRVSNSKNGAPSARAQVQRVMGSCVAGHRQGLETAVLHAPGKTYRGIIAGSFYQHEEAYLTPIGETYWRGVLMLNDIQRGGSFDLCEVSLDFLRRKYG